MKERAHDRALLGGVVLCGCAVAAYSSWAQFSIAYIAGYPVYLAWVVPVATDATAAVGTRAWVSPHYSNEIRTFGKRLAGAAILLSFITAALHLVVPTTGPIPWEIRLVIGGFPSAALAGLIHLAALAAKDKPKAGRSSARKTTPTRVVAASAAQVPAVESSSIAGQVATTENATNLSSPVNTAPKTDSRRAQMLAYLDQNPDASGADLDAQFGTTHYGRKVRSAWLQAHRGLRVVAEQASGE